MIREFREEDLDHIMEIWLNTNVQAHQFIPKQYWLNNFDRVKELLPTSEIYVDEQGNRRGFIGIIDGYIAGIFVVDSEQSKGIGRQLIELAKSKYNKLTLAVYEKNTQAIAFYKKQGFKPIKRSVDEYTGETEIHMIWMRK